MGKRNDKERNHYQDSREIEVESWEKMKNTERNIQIT